MHVAGQLAIHESSHEEKLRMQALMDEYRDLPMDLADASLVAATEARNVRRIFTLDGHFYAYRNAGGESLEIIP